MSEILDVATTKGLFTMARWERRITIDRTNFLGDHVTMVLRDPKTHQVWAAVGHGHFGPKLHRSDDDGVTFQQLTAPKYPEKPEGVEDIDQWGKPIPWSLQRMWALERGGNPGELWCGTVPGGLFHSTDDGDNWTMVRSLWDHPDRKRWFGGGLDLPGLHSICVDPRDGAHLTVAVSCGGVWETRDRGESWVVRGEGMFADFMPPEKKHDPVVQDPHHMVLCPAAPDHLWIQHHNGIFRSTDAARKWTPISGAPSSFGFAVAVHPRDPDTAWFVPAIKDEKRIPVDGKVVVSRTRNGGQSFEVLRSGLPQENSYDLCYRHALDVDTTGDRLAFGSTTGSLWTSDDQGDQWLTVSKHLPPIVAVKFGK